MLGCRFVPLSQWLVEWRSFWNIRLASVAEVNEMISLRTWGVRICLCLLIKNLTSIHHDWVERFRIHTWQVKHNVLRRVVTTVKGEKGKQEAYVTPWATLCLCKNSTPWAVFQRLTLHRHKLYSAHLHKLSKKIQPFGTWGHREDVIVHLQVDWPLSEGGLISHDIKKGCTMI